MTHSPVLLTLDGLATARLTRLIIADTITEPLRERLIGSRPGVSMDLGAHRIMVAARPRVAQFISCPWCVSPYVAAAVLACQALAATVWLFVSAILAFSLLAGLISEHS